MTVTKEMIEAAAKAMCEEDGFLWNAGSCMETSNGEEPEEQREYWLDKAETALTAALSAQPAPAVPDGWKLVPVEPTEEMNQAAYNADLDIYWTYSADGRPGGSKDVYRAMLAAAPQPPTIAVPDAWQWRMKNPITSEWREWQNGRANVSDAAWASGNFEERPLYATQPADAPGPMLASVHNDETGECDGVYVESRGMNKLRVTVSEIERLQQENERLRQRLNHYIKATIDKNSDLIAAEARVNTLQADASILLARLNVLQEATGHRLEGEDAALVDGIRAALKGGEA